MCHALGYYTLKKERNKQKKESVVVVFFPCVKIKKTQDEIKKGFFW